MTHTTPKATRAAVLAALTFVSCTTPMPDHSRDMLPDVHEFTRVVRSLAALDAVLSPRREGRYHSCNARWSPGETMASMRDGSGDGWFAEPGLPAAR